MSFQNDLHLIQGIVNRLDSSRVARLSYTQDAFDGDAIEGVSAFDVSADQNIPLSSLTDYNPTIIDKGVRTQGASIPRMAWNHYIGRISFNLNKIIQRLKVFFQLNAVAWAHNASEFDPFAAYAAGDVCYTVENVNGVLVYTWWSKNAVTFPGSPVSPLSDATNQYWTEMQSKTSASALLPFSSPGYRHKYAVADLTGLSGDYWYPVTTALQDFEAAVSGAKEGAVQILLEAYCNGQVAGQSNPHRAEFGVLSRFTGYAASSADIVVNNAFTDQADGTEREPGTGPIGYSKLVKGRQAVLWLRGGSRYALWNSFGSAFTLHTAAYGNGVDETIQPETHKVSSILYGYFKARVKSSAATASDDAVIKAQADGSLPMPKALSAGSQLNAVRTPGSYYALSADGIGQMPAADFGPFDLRVEGDPAGLSITVQHAVSRTTGAVYERTFNGSAVVQDWYAAYSPDRTAALNAAVTKLAGIEAGAQVNPGAATPAAAGLMSTADKAKLDGIQDGAQVNPGAATPSAAGLMSTADKAKLDGIQDGAQVNPGAATPSAAGLMSTADKAKLDTVQAGAQPNPGPATTSAAGLMSTADKAKLDTVQAGAQPNPGPATTSAAGLMSTADKAKLDLTTPGSAGIPLVVRADENGAALYALYNGQDILLHVLSTDPYLPTDIVNFMVYRNGGSPGATLFWEIVASSLNYMSIAWGTNLLYKMSDVLTCDLEIPAGTTVTLTAYDFLGNVATATAVVLDHVPYPTRTAVSTTLLSRSVVSGYGIPAVSNGRYAIFPMVGTSAYPTAVEAVDHTLTKVTATPVSVGRQSYACARFKDRAFIGGGFINSNLNSSSVIDVYDARLVRTTPVTLSVARYYLAAAANDTHILFGGGQASSAGYIDPVDAFDANLVRTTATLSQGGRYLGAAANDTHVLFGGGEPASGSSYTDVVDAFDAALVRSNPTGLSLQRRYVSAARAGQYVVFAGGYTSSVSYSQRTVDAYDKQLTRHIPAEFVTAQAACCACSLFQRYAIFFPGYLTSSYVHVYDDMLVYTTTTNLSISTRHLRAAVVGKYVIVQDNESGNNSTHTEIYELT